MVVCVTQTLSVAGVRTNEGQILIMHLLRLLQDLSRQCSDLVSDVKKEEDQHSAEPPFRQARFIVENCVALIRSVSAVLRASLRNQRKTSEPRKLVTHSLQQQRAHYKECQSKESQSQHQLFG